MFRNGPNQLIERIFAPKSQIDEVAQPIQKNIQGLFQRAGQTAADFLNGVWLGHPLHPVLTDVPLGAWTAAVALDTLEDATGDSGIGQAADAAVAIGVAGAVGSAVTGLADWQHTTGESRRVGFAHAALNSIALGFFVGSLVARGNRSRGLGQALSLAGFAVAATSALLGGDLVYRQKIGVNHAPDETSAEDFTAVLPEAQLPENQLTRGMLKDTPLVLLRQGERIYALAETCAHLGGPLAEGDLEMDSQGLPIVICPWHGSRFEMASGAVINGPSTFPQPCFEARIRAGQVEVRQQKAG
jgi:nitrite reductase/ring-hydroxylating ferredoxin subunit/uncharacterized membrane protein